MVPTLSVSKYRLRILFHLLFLFQTWISLSLLNGLTIYIAMHFRSWLYFYDIIPYNGYHLIGTQYILLSLIKYVKFDLDQHNWNIYLQFFHLKRNIQFYIEEMKIHNVLPSPTGNFSNIDIFYSHPASIKANKSDKIFHRSRQQYFLEHC